MEATIGERFPLLATHKDGTTIARYQYGKVISANAKQIQQYLHGCVYAYVIIMTLLGAEYKGRELDVAHDYDIDEVMGHEAIEKVVHSETAHHRHSGSDEEEKLKE